MKSTAKNIHTPLHGVHNGDLRAIDVIASGEIGGGYRQSLALQIKKSRATIVELMGAAPEYKLANGVSDSIKVMPYIHAYTAPEFLLDGQITTDELNNRFDRAVKYATDTLPYNQLRSTLIVTLARMKDDALELYARSLPSAKPVLAIIMIILGLFFIGVVVYLNYIPTNVPVKISLGILGACATVFGILRFFGIDFTRIMRWLKGEK